MPNVVDKQSTKKKNEKHIENIPIKRKDKTSVLFAFNNNLI